MLFISHFPQRKKEIATVWVLIKKKKNKLGERKKGLKSWFYRMKKKNNYV